MDKAVFFQRVQVARGVREVARSVAFYERHLGFETLSKMGDDFALLGRDDITMALVLAPIPIGQRQRRTSLGAPSAIVEDVCVDEGSRGRAFG